MPLSVRLRYWAAVAAWMVLISFLSTDAFSADNTHRYIDPLLRFLFPGIGREGIFFAHAVIRKSAHFVEFFVLSLLVFWAMRAGRLRRWRRDWALTALVVSGLFGLVDEWHQAFGTARTPSLGDSGIDFAGALAAQAMLFLGRAARRTAGGRNVR
ncbi:MAG: hypothetical protein KatS3mg076_1921 [Candidatus Binatia bacterium]|nr:MAG: hypothetical protein KatS3mg076_1921 [Candidatus Binatia bacterium]